jgi:hypothetical protein
MKPGKKPAAEITTQGPMWCVQRSHETLEVVVKNGRLPDPAHADGSGRATLTLSTHLRRL